MAFQIIGFWAFEEEHGDFSPCRINWEGTDSIFSNQINSSFKKTIQSVSYWNETDWRNGEGRQVKIRWSIIA